VTARAGTRQPQNGTARLLERMLERAEEDDQSIQTQAPECRSRPVDHATANPSRTVDNSAPPPALEHPKTARRHHGNLQRQAQDVQTAKPQTITNT